MNDEQRLLTKASSQKAVDAINLVEASLSYLKPYDDGRYYSPRDREPYDALSDRFVRAVEVCIKFFRSYEKLMFAENSQTLRDLLNRMEKLDFIDTVYTWMEMRDVRNRIVHEYLPQEIKKIYDAVMGTFSGQLRKVKKRIEGLTF